MATSEQTTDSVIERKQCGDCGFRGTDSMFALRSGGTACPKCSGYDDVDFETLAPRSISHQPSITAGDEDEQIIHPTSN
jgi:hypothetical protein